MIIIYTQDGAESGVESAGWRAWHGWHGGMTRSEIELEGSLTDLEFGVRRK